MTTSFFVSTTMIKMKTFFPDWKKRDSHNYKNISREFEIENAVTLTGNAILSKYGT